MKDFRDMIRDIAQAGDSVEARLRKAREIGYDDWLLREEGHLEDEGNSRLDNLEELCVASGAFPSPADFLAFVAAQNKPKDEAEVGRCGGDDDHSPGQRAWNGRSCSWSASPSGCCPITVPCAGCDEEKTLLLADSIEEERRLAYVAITRAKQRVFLSWPLQHQTRALTRSPFLGEMPSLPELLAETLLDKTA